MRAEVREIQNTIAAIKSAGKEIGASASELIERMERRGLLDTRPVDEDWGVAEALIEAAANAKHFTNRFGDELEEYKLFVTAAKVEFLGLAAKPSDKAAVSRAEDSLWEKLHAETV